MSSISYSDDLEYSDSDDDYVAKKYSKIDWERFPPNSVVIPLSKMPNIENDPENPKDLKQVFNKMRTITAKANIITLPRMLNMLITEGFLSQAQEIKAEIVFNDDLPEVVMHTVPASWRSTPRPTR